MRRAIRVILWSPLLILFGGIFVLVLGQKAAPDIVDTVLVGQIMLIAYAIAVVLWIPSLVLSQVLGLPGKGRAVAAPDGDRAEIDKADARVRQRLAKITGARTTNKAPSNREAKQLIADMVEFNLKVLAHDVPEMACHASPVRLKLAMTEEECAGSRSWIGGNPSLPDDVPWPELEGAPANFYAQVNCAELPDGIWGGLGPKEGWLCFFASRGHLSKVAVLHTLELGKERQAPVPPAHYDGIRNQRPRLAEMTGDTAKLAPRWFLVPTPVDTNLEPDYQNNWPARDKRREWKRDFWKNTFSPTRCPPPDREAAIVLIESFQTYLERQLQPDWRAAIERSDPTGARLAAFDRAKGRFDELAGDYRSELEGGSFRFESARAFSEALMTIDTSGWWNANAKVKPEVLGLHETPVQDYFDFLETDLRVRYRDDPSSMPEPYRSDFFEYWRICACGEAPFMGGVPHEGFVYSRIENPVFLLELPSSDLLGWYFGDLYSMAFFIRLEDFEQRNWEAAWGDVAN